MTRKELLEQIQAVGIMAVDLNLFLDNHPHNNKALQDYEQVSEHLKSLKSQYEQQYGPLNHFGHSSSYDHLKLINDPWPWERK